MIKNTLFTILLTFIMTTTAVAQTDADQENDDSGIYIGLSLMGTSFEVDDFLDGTDTGGGLNLELGYDFNSNISIFLGLDGSNMNPDEGEDYSLAHIDLGVEGRIGDSSSKFLPFGRLSLTGLAAQFEDFDEDIELSGAGVGLGIGTYYYPTPKFALKIGYTHSWIELTEVSAGSVSLEIEEQARTGRLMLGGSYHF